MYEQHFGLRTMPFRVVPSPSFMFPSDTHEESRARILYGIRENRGFVVVSGAVGLGKTTVLLSVLEELDTAVQTALVVHPVTSFRDLLRLVCLEFGIEARNDDEVTLLWELNLFLVERLAEGKTCVLMIDEAQNVPLDVLERVRTLSNLQTENSSLLQIVLVGQPELLTHLDDPRLPQLRQRVGVWHEILPLTAEETQKYVWHRLGLAGAAEPEKLAPAVVCVRVHEAARGVPRLINQICDTALVIAYGDGAPALSPEHVDEARRELRLEAPAPPVATAPVEAEPVAAAPDPTPPPAPVEPAPRRSRSAWIAPLAAAAVLVLLILAAVRFGLLPGWPLSGATAADGLQAESTGVTELADTTAGPQAVDAADDSSEPDVAVARSLPESWEASAARVAELRRRGTVLFSAHLASFREPTGVERFAAALMAEHPEWDVPLYVEVTDDSPAWHRVYGGGFTERTEALRFARRIKQSGTVQFANVERMNGRVEEFVPTAFQAPRTSNPGESG